MQIHTFIRFLYRWVPHNHETQMCVCSKCGRRNNRSDLTHELVECRCIRCGAIVHNFAGCICIRCSATRDEDHSWNGCICLCCHKVRDEEHTWNGCTCLRCDTVRNEIHNWNGAFKNDCACTRCGAHHSWEELERHEWSTTYGYFDENSPGTIHDTGIVTGEIEHGETKSKCVMCGEKVTHTW